VLTVKQAAARLNVSQALVYALCQRGKLAHERFGLGRGTIRITEEAVAAYRESSCVSAVKTTATQSPAAYRQLDGARLAVAWRERGAVQKCGPESQRDKNGHPRPGR
jgi:excisionase family DNA binding protein